MKNNYALDYVKKKVKLNNYFFELLRAVSLE